jgi:hypothetical protein
MTRENASARLIVKGRDDKHSVIHLMERHNVDWDNAEDSPPYIRDCGGIDLLLKSIPISAKSYPRLGIMIDANNEIQSRWTCVKSRLASVGVKLPNSPDANGTIINGFYEDWRVGVWLMPDNNSQGTLEHFLKTLVPTSDQCWSYAKEAAEHVKEIGAKFPDKKSLKARIYTWLSWQEEPGLPFGTAITATYFTHDSPEALRFVGWFNRLFFPNP